MDHLTEAVARQTEAIEFRTGGDDAEIGRMEYAYDPRLCKIEDTYYVTWCNGYVYSIGAALLDIDEPWKVRYRAKSHLLTPETDYETTGFVPNVCFPCAALCDADTGRLAVYYGAADTYVAVAFTQIDELVEFIKTDSGV